jgi:DNA invertase Pin-like site-specific DNA recombinase
MLERQREGIAKVKADGKYKGHPTSVNVYEVNRVARLIGLAAAAEQLDIAHSSVYRMLKQPIASANH